MDWAYARDERLSRTGRRQGRRDGPSFSNVSRSGSGRPERAAAGKLESSVEIRQPDPPYCSPLRQISIRSRIPPSQPSGRLSVLNASHDEHSRDITFRNPTPSNCLQPDPFQLPRARGITAEKDPVKAVKKYYSLRLVMDDLLEDTNTSAGALENHLDQLHRK